MNVNYYDKLYYSFFKLLGKLGKYDLGFKAMILLSAIIFTNILTIIFLITNESKLAWLTTYLGISVIIVPLLIINYFYFVAYGRYKKIDEEINLRGENYNLYWSIGYMLASIILLLIVIIN